MYLLACAFRYLATDWPTYGHDPGSTHYSPLKQIDTTNVSKLTRAWTFHMNSAGGIVGIWAGYRVAKSL